MCNHWSALFGLKKANSLATILKNICEFDYTIGGNNSREAMQQLLKEHSELKGEKIFSHRLCSVYSPMDTTLALRLASKHNRATTFIHEMTTWDKV